MQVQFYFSNLKIYSLQRQFFLQPLENDNIVVSGLLFSLYLSVVGSPIILYVISVIILTIKRNLSMAISMLMISMIHPIVSLTFGLSMKSLRQFISNFWPKKYKVKSTIWKRLMTFSINVYLSLIGMIIYYLILMDLCPLKENNYKNQNYDQCYCDKLKRDNQQADCKNEEENVQNIRK